ncbi:MAG: nucleotide pyrophosphohydrolase [Patescibacteria group bacterium]|nr:nucleotide pyrophosphohydrolase [Patescibacteria group bacterium]MDD5121564.1 nucleotide pyrophosphohydrolase [Patescibacteria group bacterium]MDD5222238.1 nucleotide pyrophosphohydrolase [Patescibacteria group bacterium]MDD5396272.1 nucleotide pyrophosphohydrolase [Patescibacteria group bacterium]
MDIKKMQKIVDNWVKTNTQGYWKPNNMMLRLMEEIGELSRAINHKFGEKKKKSQEIDQEISLEIADVLFAITCIANSLNIDLTEAFKRMIEKYEKRDKYRHR